MRTNLIKLVRRRVDTNGVEHWEAHINPKNVRCIDPGVRDLGLTCECHLSSRLIARIRKSPTTYRNGTRWSIWYDSPRIDRYFSGFGETVGISLERVKEIMNVAMRRAFENHEFGVFQDGILLNN